VQGDGTITLGLARHALDRLEVDNLGLDAIDRQVLRAIIERFDGGPVGIETIAATISEEVETIEDVYEPFLLQRGLLARTPRGRAWAAWGRRRGGRSGRPGGCGGWGGCAVTGCGGAGAARCTCRWLPGAC